MSLKNSVFALKRGENHNLLFYTTSYTKRDWNWWQKPDRTSLQLHSLTVSRHYKRTGDSCTFFYYFSQTLPTTYSPSKSSNTAYGLRAYAFFVFLKTTMPVVQHACNSSLLLCHMKHAIYNLTMYMSLIPICMHVYLVKVGCIGKLLESKGVEHFLSTFSTSTLTREIQGKS